MNHCKIFEGAVVKDIQGSNFKKVEKVLHLLEKGWLVENACKRVGLSKPTFYHWKRGYLAHKDLPIRAYAEILTSELKKAYGILISKKDALALVKKVFCVPQGEDLERSDYVYKEPENYIKLTHHQMPRN
jgi:ACT domain-containing protein